jgi:hypothetical protein
MDKETAQAAIQFMLRVSLRGQEVPAFNIVMAALNKIASEPEGTDVRPQTS